MLRALLILGLVAACLAAVAPDAAAGPCPPGHYDLPAVGCFCPPVQCGGYCLVTTLGCGGVVDLGADLGPLVVLGSAPASQLPPAALHRAPLAPPHIDAAPGPADPAAFPGHAGPSPAPEGPCPPGHYDVPVVGCLCPPVLCGTLPALLDLGDVVVVLLLDPIGQPASPGDPPGTTPPPQGPAKAHLPAAGG